MAKYIDEFRDSETAKRMMDILSSYSGDMISIMEVCGTHTMSISRFGIRGALPSNIRLISGPGCPVCVTPISYINSAIKLANRENVIITTFGDLMRVPGTSSSLAKEKAEGRDIRIVYSPLDSLKIAAQNPERKVVFLSIGFETTTPAVAATILKAESEGLDNFSALTANKTMPEILRLLAADPDMGIDGYLYPGNVSAIIGVAPYEKLAEKYGISGVITGFEPLDILYSLVYFITNMKSEKAWVYNQYSRAVRREGNPAALATMYKVFEPCDSYWRGIGTVPGSGIRIKDEYGKYDAWKVFDLTQHEAGEPAGCLCGEVLRGKATPEKCGLFKTVCSPESPVGACMVSSEGTCAAYYRYGGN